MMSKKVISIILGFLAAAVPAIAQKRKVTIMDFGYATVRTQVQAYFGTDQDIGKGISDLLIDQVLAGGDYRVIERSALDKIIKEQNFSNSDRANPATAAKIGALVGVDAMIIGDITAFGNDDKHYGGGGGGSTGWWNKTGAGGLGISKSKTIVEITARIVDVNTGEILASVNGHGEVQKSGLSAAGGGSSGWSGGGGKFDMGSSNFAQSAIGQAVKAAVTQVATGLDQKAASLPPPVGPPPPPPPAAAPPLDGVVADASSPDIILNVGSKDGVKVGDTLSVVRIGRVIKDPVTGKPLRSIESAVGTLKITSADPDSSVGTFSGAGAPKIGDHVKRMPAN